jgi:hypothetical protein
MDPRRSTPPPSGQSWPPAVRPRNPIARPEDVRPEDVYTVDPPTGPPSGESTPPETPAHRWRRLTRTRQGASGLAILVAALLLWPFAGWFWIPWVAGLVVLVLIALLRLDRLLHGWAGHVAGLAVVIGLMLATGPWDWALAASLGVLLAGLVQWPWWRLAAVGAVLCLVAGTGWGVDRYRVAQERAAQEAQRSQENMSQLGERSPDRVLPALVEGIGQGDVVGVCGLLAEPARNQFATVAGTPDCASAVAHFHSALPRVPPLRGLAAPVAATAAGATVDGCRTVWASRDLGGPTVGVLQISKAPPPGQTYFISAFAPCAAG